MMELPDVLLVLGCALVSIGAGLIYLPAGIITAGVCMIGFALMLGRNKAQDVI
jgi:hypothetical protein